MFWHSSCHHLQALSMLIYFVRINATFADFVSSSPLYTFAMFSSLVHLRTQAHTPLGGEDMTWINGVFVCLQKSCMSPSPTRRRLPFLTKVHLLRCDPTPPLYRYHFIWIIPLRLQLFSIYSICTAFLCITAYLKTTPQFCIIRNVTWPPSNWVLDLPPSSFCEVTIRVSALLGCWRLRHNKVLTELRIESIDGSRCAFYLDFDTATFRW